MIEERCYSCFVNSVKEFIRDYDTLKKTKRIAKRDIENIIERLWKEFNNTICSSHLRKTMVIRCHIKAEGHLRDELAELRKEINKISKEIGYTTEKNYIDEMFTEIFNF